MFGTTIGSSIGSNIKQEVVYKQKKKNQQPRYHEYIADYGGCGHWRLLWPQMLLNSTQKIVGSNSSTMILEDTYYKGLSAVRVQRQVTPVQLDFIKVIKEKSKRLGFKLLYDIDDIFVLEDIPKYNAFRGAYDNAKLQASAKKIMSMADTVTVPCEEMKSYYEQYNKNVKIIKNYAPKFWLDNLYDKDKVLQEWGNTTKKKKPKIMYAGSAAHYDVKNNNNGIDDLSHVLDVIRKTKNDYEWIFMGAIPPGLTDLARAKKITVYTWQNIYNLPRFVKDLNVNIFIAPLNDNVFNRCKSDIKILEAGAYGVPCICQDLPTYKQSPLKFNTGDELHDHIKSLLGDVDVYMNMSKKYNDILQDRWLDDKLDEYMDLFKK